MESKQEQLESALNDSKVQAAKELSDVKVALEQSQETAKVVNWELLYLGWKMRITALKCLLKFK